MIPVLISVGVFTLLIGAAFVWYVRNGRKRKQNDEPKNNEPV